MRFAVVTQLSADGIPTTVVPIMSGDLADAVLERLKVRVKGTCYAECETALREAFTAEEKAVREATISLGPEHE